MNTDYIIYITTKNGKTWKYQKENKSWTQTAPTGKLRQLTAEQLLSHLLPPLASDQPNLTITVKRKTKKASKTPSINGNTLFPSSQLTFPSGRLLDRNSMHTQKTIRGTT